MKKPNRRPQVARRSSGIQVGGRGLERINDVLIYSLLLMALDVKLTREPDELDYMMSMRSEE
jgi:hypothetical protein